jgi:hypothetical protein
MSKNRIRAGFIPSVVDRKQGRSGNKQRELAVYMGEARFIRGAGLMTLSPRRLEMRDRQKKTGRTRRKK